MRKVSIVIALCFVFALALSLMGQAPPELQTAMKGIAPTFGSLGMNIDSGNAAGVATDAAKLETLFKDAESFFMKSKIQQAATWAKEASDAAGAAAKAAKAGTVDKSAKAAI